ncbi:MAG TPA: V4R domain-containing protein [Thermoplasmata archaeon]|jgi:predicted hydrocarbon binding protein|nr:V4R domain-containing protein [Thermoplasmata archaeon]
MRYVKISQDEFAAVRKLYESVMSYACHGLFFREGQSIADGVAKEVERHEDLLVGARRVLISRGWVEDVQFSGNQIRVAGSIEVSPGSEAETCHRLRGIVARIYEMHTKERVKLTEIACESTGSERCVFKMEVV